MYAFQISLTNSSSSIAMKMMKASHFLWQLILFCFCFSLPRLYEGRRDELGMLRKLINAQRSSSSFQSSDLVSELETIKSSKKVHLIPQEGSMEGDRISELPGQPEPANFNQYAGYITVDSYNGRALFYYFVESPINASRKPLLLWLHSGFFCSSIGSGAMAELGPFNVNSDGKTLRKNIHAWNSVANVIFLETPTGVGFSYSNRTLDYNSTGDRRTAQDSYSFLINWMERFPQYKNHDLFIAGEFFAGFFVPDLAYKILQKNKATHGENINIRGIAIGNPYINPTTDILGQNDYLWSHALFSDKTYFDLLKYCDFSNLPISDKCLKIYKRTDDEMGKINFNNIYAPLCQGQAKAATYLGDYDPCWYEHVEAYLNNPEVQKALHAKIIKWNLCSEPYVANDSPFTKLPIIKKLIAAKLNIWLYSGDLSAWSTIIGTRYFIKSLQLPVKNPWKPWYLDNEVGGYVDQYEGLTLATVKGAGQHVPRDQPARALAMITSFLRQEDFA